jgi:two-component sensor histidine kinase
MTVDGALVIKLRRQQTAIADFGTFALRQSDLLTVLKEAAKVCAKGLDVPYAKICQYRPDKNNLKIVAGFGWDEGVIGYVMLPDNHTPQGRAFITGKPSICKVLFNEEDFILPPFYAEHGIISTVDVVIKGDEVPYGVLEIDSDRQEDYDQHDIDFLTGFANVLAEAVATSARIEALNSSIECLAALMDEKDQLLDQKKVLAEELHHRVRNNLQLVGGMLSKQVDDTVDVLGRRGLKAISRRVFTLAQVYDQLAGSEMTRSIDFSAYVEALCTNIAEVQAPLDGSVRLHYEGQPVMLDLDEVTALGIVVAELVANSFEHAFQERGGLISVVLRPETSTSTAVVLVDDDGIGFTPRAGSKRHGIGLVLRLVEQIGGTAKVETHYGTHWTIIVPIKSVPAVTFINKGVLNGRSKPAMRPHGDRTIETRQGA